jgi:hypothetical protein
LVLETAEYHQVIIFGSEFITMQIALEMNATLRYKLRMMGVPIEGASNTFGDNASVIKNVTLPESTLLY